MTALPDGYRLVDVPPDRRRDVVELDTWAFPSSLDTDKAAELPFPLTWGRVRGVVADDGELVAVHASYPFGRFPVPGGRTPVAGLTWVGVHPGHRRRGLLRAMIDDHVARSRARGEAVSALFAAEPAIYGRFGYGLAAHDLRLTVPRGAALRDVPGADRVRVRLELFGGEHHELVHRLHASVERPGWATHETEELRAVTVADPDVWRGGAESKRIALAEVDGAVVGYAVFRRKEDWQPAGPRGQVQVQEVVAPDPAVARALWGVLVDLDLTATVRSPILAVDDPLLHLLVDVRATTPRLGDNVWVRVLDVPAALAARRWAAPVDVVLSVTDALVPGNAGAWRLTGDRERSTVERTDDPADVELDVRELGAAYLGGVSLASLAAGGLVAERTPGTLDAAAAAFTWPTAPVCGWVF